MDENAEPGRTPPAGSSWWMPEPSASLTPTGPAGPRRRSPARLGWLRRWIWCLFPATVAATASLFLLGHAVDAQRTTDAWTGRTWVLAGRFTGDRATSPLIHHLMYVVTIPADAPTHAGQAVEVAGPWYPVVAPLDGSSQQYFFRVSVQEGSVRVLDSAQDSEQVDRALAEHRRDVAGQARSAWLALLGTTVLGGGAAAAGAWYGRRQGIARTDR